MFAGGCRHLDPFGTAVNYLDAAFRNVRNLGIVSVTSTDTGSLYSKAPNVTLRHYGCQIVRTEYYKELAARMVVAAVARCCKLKGNFLGQCVIVLGETQFRVSATFVWSSFCGFGNTCLFGTSLVWLV